MVYRLDHDHVIFTTALLTTAVREGKRAMATGDAGAPCPFGVGAVGVHVGDGVGELGE